MASTACDRNVGPFDPDEEPREPDLSRIFPEGAKQAAAPQIPRVPREPLPRGTAPAADGPGDPVQGTVRVAPELAEGMPSGAVLFIIARRGDSGPPLAVKRVFDPSFPLDFTLGPEDRMIQAMPFAGPFQITARLDGDGNAMSRTPGDLSGAAPAPVTPGTTGIDVLIDQRL